MPLRMVAPLVMILLGLGSLALVLWLIDSSVKKLEETEERED